MVNREEFNPAKFEKKWQKRWEEEDIYKTPSKIDPKEKFYCLDMFPYPSGAGLHVGHVEGYTATDIYSRYMRMQGFQVLHPMGWDAFGLPAENYAIKTGIHPKEITDKAIKTFTHQIKSLGLSYDWQQEISTHQPDYYRWTQWFFLLLYKMGLVYKKKAPVNWCPSCQTVLANEQVVDGKCERCGTEVVQKEMDQWFFKITAYADELLEDLKKIDWPESTKEGQKNWIGRSEGALIKFKIFNLKFENFKEGEYIEVFTTRPDTLFGATYLVLAPEHPLVNKITTPKYQETVKKYQEETRKKTALQRSALEKEKTGVFTGAYALHPVNGRKLPVWIADYILMTYGTGAIMAVPAHDERDFQFARKYGLEIQPVIKPEKGEWDFEERAFTEEGVNINSGFLDGLKTRAAKERIISWLEKRGFGKKDVRYKLRDWLISRQRYWGAPIPVIYCTKCGTKEKPAIIPVPEKDLPVELPDDVDFKPTGESPLKYSKKFHDVVCPVCGAKGKGVVWRESDTMDTFVDSSWYFFRFTDPKNEKEFASKEAIKTWMPVDLYVGGAEHTVLHLLYSRFFTKVLRDAGYIDFSEPFLKLRHQGLILAEDGRKMSKRWGNVINPDDEVKKFGADTVRLYEMFMGPIKDAKPWSTAGEKGVYRFLKKVWRLQYKVREEKSNEREERQINKLIAYVGENIERLNMNVIIARFMEFVNSYTPKKRVPLEVWKRFLLVMAPFAPHITEELWARIGMPFSIHQQAWPEYNPELITNKKIKIAVAFNGKTRGTLEVNLGLTKEEVIDKVKTNPKLSKYYLENKIKKTIFVKDKIINFVGV